MNRRSFLALASMALMLPAAQSLKRLVVFEGNSISALNNGIQPQCWVTQFVSGKSFCAVNVAVSGDDIRHANMRAPIYVDPLRELCDIGVCVFWEGTNSIPLNNYDADITFKQHFEYCMDRKKAGWRVVLGTTMNRRFIGYGVEDDGRHELARLRFNQLVRANWREFDGILDAGADAMLGNVNSAWDKMYFVDGVHLTQAGARRVADIAEEVIAPLLTPTFKFFPLMQN